MPTFAGFREALPDAVRGLPDVTGLVWAGASAEPSRADEWSDHDFFLLVRAGAEERFRGDLSWLPWPDEIAFASRETTHGFKVVYRDGFVLEFAVFGGDELANAVVNHHAIAFGDEALRQMLPGLVRNTVPADPLTVDDHLGLFYALLLIGSGRYRRGERLVAGQAVRSHAVGHLLAVARLLLPSEQPEARDALDPWRRVEHELPAFAAELDEVLACPVPHAAQGLAELGVRWFGAHSTVPAVASAVLAERLGWNAG